MTRRFSVGTMMILMTFYAVLFSALKMFDAGLPVVAGFGIFFAGIGAGQMLFFNSREPRMASFVTGLLMGIFCSMIVLALAVFTPREKGADLASAMYFSLIFLICGVPLGYLAGGLIAGIFLFREREEQAAEEKAINENGAP